METGRLTHALWLAGWPLAFGWIVSCTLSADLDPLNNGQCPPDQKACAGKCVSRLDPVTGCSLLGCAPCALEHANAACGPNGECIVASCLGTYDNCDRIDANGCEVNKEDNPVYCGTCDLRSVEPCNIPNGVRGCSAGHCAIATCNPGWGDCDRSVQNGCETDLATTPSSCGGCGIVCQTGTCVGGKCP